MAEYIDKQAAIKELCETYEHEYPTASGAFDEYATRIVPNVLRNLPPADVRPVVRGRWESNGDGFGWVFICSVCGFIDGHPFNDRMNYCPNCGADMRGEQSG